MMHYYWVKHGIRPSVFYNMPKGEQLVIRAFFERELEEREETFRELKDTPVYPVSIV